MKKLLNLIAGIGIFKLLFAYLDPGTGSLIIQLIVGTLVGLAVIFRSSFTSILYMLGLRKPSKDHEDDDIQSIEDESDSES